MRAGEIKQVHCTYRIRVSRDLGGSIEDGVAGELLAVAHDREGTTLKIMVMGQNIELRLPGGYEVEVLDENGRAFTS